MRLYFPPPRTILAAATAPPDRSFFINLHPVVLQKMIHLCVKILVLSLHCGFFSHLRSCRATASTTAPSGKQERARPNYYDQEAEAFSVARHQEVGELLQRSHAYHPLEDRKHAGERTATGARPTGSASGPPRTLYASLLQEEQRQLQRRREAQTQRLAADSSSPLTAHRFMYAPSSPLWTSVSNANIMLSGSGNKSLGVLLSSCRFSVTTHEVWHVRLRMRTKFFW